MALNELQNNDKVSVLLDRLKVGQGPLKPSILVRFQVQQPACASTRRVEQMVLCDIMLSNMEGLKQKIENEKTLESRDQEISDKLNSLGIKFEGSINSDGKLVYTFPNARKLDHSAFKLDTDGRNIVYQAVHFGEGKFEEPGSEKEVTPNELIQYLSEKFPEADAIIFSCCDPDGARALLSSTDDKFIFIGTGSGTYSTWYNDKENKLSSVRNSER